MMPAQMKMNLFLMLGTMMLPRGGMAYVDSVKSWATWIEGLRRFSVAVYLTSIALGLATIATVLRFQSQRLLELAQEKSAS